MGAAAQCTVHYGGKVATGRALLETDEILFRGEFTLVVAFRDIRRVAASTGRLTVTFSGGTAVFDLGSKAEAWAEKIRHPKGLLDKLGVRTGATAVLVGVGDLDFRAQLAGRRVRVSTRPGSNNELIFLGVSIKADLARLRALARRLAPDGAMWVVAPRGATVVREADVLAAGKLAGLVDVKVVRFSDTHTAHKFVIPVAKRQGRRAG